LVELDRHRAGEEVPLHHARLPAERVELADPAYLALPLALGVGVEAAVEAGRDDKTVAELLAEPGRQREAVLVVEGVLMLAEQHGPLRTTLSHHPPVRNPTVVPAADRRHLVPELGARAGQAACEGGGDRRHVLLPEALACDRLRADPDRAGRVGAVRNRAPDLGEQDVALCEPTRSGCASAERTHVDGDLVRAGEAVLRAENGGACLRESARERARVRDAAVRVLARRALPLERRLAERQQAGDVV